MKLLAKLVFVLFLTIALTSCATHSVYLAGQGNVTSPVEMKSYRINLQDEESWEDWAASKYVESDSLVMEKLTYWPPTGEILGSTSISIRKDNLTSDGWELSEKEIADGIMRMEETEMREKGLGEGERKLELTEVKKDTIQHNGKSFYVMNFKAQSGSKVGAYLKQIPVIDAALYIHFPENFSRDHIVYKFLIVDSYKLGRLTAKTGLSHIFPVLDGFEITTN